MTAAGTLAVSLSSTANTKIAFRTTSHATIFSRFVGTSGRGDREVCLSSKYVYRLGSRRRTRGIHGRRNRSFA